MSAPRKCTCKRCGHDFESVTASNYCPDCRKYKRDYARRQHGWTEEEIRLGHRIKEKEK